MDHKVAIRLSKRLQLRSLLLSFMEWRVVRKTGLVKLNKPYRNFRRRKFEQTTTRKKKPPWLRTPSRTRSPSLIRPHWRCTMRKLRSKRKWNLIQVNSTHLRRRRRVHRLKLQKFHLRYNLRNQQLNDIPNSSKICYKLEIGLETFR